MKMIDWLDHMHLSQREFAPRLGVQESYFSLLCTGKRYPTLKRAILAERLTNGMVRATQDWIPEELLKP